jgi:hypothetical protein
MTVVVICYVRYAMKTAKREAEMDRQWAKEESDRLKTRNPVRNRPLE